MRQYGQQQQKKVDNLSYRTQSIPLPHRIFASTHCPPFFGFIGHGPSTKMMRRAATGCGHHFSVPG